MSNLIKSLVVGAFALVMANAHADPIGGPTNINCAAGNCFGSLITLEYAQVGSDPAHYVITLTIDTASNTIAGAWIQSVAIKPAGGSNTVYDSAALTADPLGTWALHIGGHSNGCNNSNAGFLCADTASVLNVMGPTYVWVFDVTLDNASDWLLGNLASSVYVNYNTATQTQGLQTSAGITLQGGGGPNEIPEPQTLALVGLGLLGLALMRRRRNA